MSAAKSAIVRLEDTECRGRELTASELAQSVEKSLMQSGRPFGSDFWDRTNTAAGTVVVQIEIFAFAMQSTQLSLNIQRFRNFLFLLSSRDGKRPCRHERSEKIKPNE